MASHYLQFEEAKTLVGFTWGTRRRGVESGEKKVMRQKSRFQIEKKKSSQNVATVIIFEMDFVPFRGIYMDRMQICRFIFVQSNKMYL